VRADRLVAILLLLQRRGQVTAAEVADELEVSVRTARRDLEALAMAGVPVFSERGRGGGWRLLGAGTTDLSGLTTVEARALFLVAGTAAEVTPEVRAALRKLVRALPETMRDEAETASRAIVVDPGGWGRRPRPPQRPHHLDELQAATTAGAQVRLGYRDRNGSTTTRVVDPLGLAQKGRVWYLVAGTDEGQRTFRVARVTSVERTGRSVTRPVGFDLTESWRDVVERVDRLRSPAELELLVREPHVQTLRWMFDDQAIVEEVASDGRTRVRIRGRHVDVLAAQVAGFGRDVEVVDPPEARKFLASLAGELREVYDGLGPRSPVERALSTGRPRVTKDERDPGRKGRSIRMDEAEGTSRAITGPVCRELAEACAARTVRIADVLDALDDASLLAPSALPGWSRLTIACHLRFGAETLAAMTAATLEGRTASYYPEGRARQRPSTLEPRDGERPADVVRSLRLRSSDLDRAWRPLSGPAWDSVVVEPDDNPDLGTIGLGWLPLLRLTELEVHAADLSLGLGEWSELFVRVALPTRLEWLNTRRANHAAFDPEFEGSWLLTATDGPTYRVEVRGAAVDARPVDPDASARATIVATSRDLLALLLGRPTSEPPRLLGDVALARRFEETFPGP
jgi:uncharacterized protein (TIGR03083 family)